MAKEKRDATGFGGRLRALRLAAGMTQQQLADRLGMRANNLARLEAGGNAPSWETALRIAKALDASLDDFKVEGE